MPLYESELEQWANPVNQDLTEPLDISPLGELAVIQSPLLLQANLLEPIDDTAVQLKVRAARFGRTALESYKILPLIWQDIKESDNWLDKLNTAGSGLTLTAFQLLGSVKGPSFLTAFAATEAYKVAGSNLPAAGVAGLAAGLSCFGLTVAGTKITDHSIQRFPTVLAKLTHKFPKFASSASKALPGYEMDASDTDSGQLSLQRRFGRKALEHGRRALVANANVTPYIFKAVQDDEPEARRNKRIALLSLDNAGFQALLYTTIMAAVTRIGDIEVAHEAESKLPFLAIALGGITMVWEWRKNSRLLSLEPEKSGASLP